MKKIVSLLLLSLVYLHSFTQITPFEAAEQMQKGINLGNTLEPPYEGGWNNPPAEEYYFDLYKQAGFQCVRVPVRWDKHTQTSSPYKISESWMQRVEEVLDWGLERDLFIVVNAHHDNWIKDNYEDPLMRARFDSIWAQISRRFMNKSEKLIFEVLNEPHGLTKAQNDDMHARVLSIIRETNPTRLVIFQGHNWGGSDELIEAAIPDDDYLIGSFHSYDPYLFGLEGQGTWGSSYDITTLRTKFQKVKDWSDTHNIPVFLGEFGAVRDCDYNSRMKHYKYYVQFALEHDFVYCAWDDGGNFRIMERQQRGWKEVKTTLLHSSANSPGSPRLSVFQDTIMKLGWVNQMTDYDSLIIERRTDLNNFHKIITLTSDSEEYLDFNLFPNTRYYYRIIAYYDNGKKLYSHPVRELLPVHVPAVREPFHGTPMEIPGVIEAEDFDIGGEGLAYHEGTESNLSGAYRPEEGVDIFEVGNQNEYHVGGIMPGEWYEYTVNVTEEGKYNIQVHVSSLQEGGSFKLGLNEVETEIFTVPATYSWLTTEKVSGELELKSGEQILRFTVIDEPLFNIDKFVFSLDKTGIAEPPHSNFQIFKNSNGNLVLNFEKANLKKISVYRIDGSLMNTFQSADTEFLITTSGYPKGIYLIQVLSDDVFGAMKIFI